MLYSLYNAKIFVLLRKCNKKQDERNYLPEFPCPEIR